MGFLISSARYILRLVILGMALRALVALYLNLWDFSRLESFDGTLGPFLYGWHFDLAIGSFFYFLLYGGALIFSLSEKAFARVNGLLLFIYTTFITVDALYAKESGRHISYEIYNLLTIRGSLGGLVKLYWLQALFAFLGAVFVAKFFTPRYRPVQGWLKRSLAFLFVACVTVVFARGFEGIPQDPSWAYRAGGGSKGATLALNGAYGMVWAAIAGKKSSKERIEIPPEVPTAEIFATWKQGRGIPQPVGNFDGNIVIVFLEGWPGVYVDKKVGEQEVLPFLNSLRRESLHVDLMLAGGHRTTEGLFATLCGLPNPPGKSIMFSEIENKNFQCFPQFLQQKGYSSAFFQGSDQFTSGVGLLVLKTGFKESYGKREIPDYQKLEQNTWGVFDKDVYKHALRRMEELPEPLLIGINTNTTHDLALPTKTKAAFGSENPHSMHLSVTHHADQEFKEFYESLTRRKWKKDWILIALSDHTSLAEGGIFEHYSIPFLMKYHSVQGSKGTPPFAQKKVPGAFGQNDVGTTLMDLTGHAAPEFLGRSLLRPGEFSDGASLFHLGQTAWFE
ncbi:MAG: LTA synthase family protein, partial [Bdellovibrio sp.]